MMHCSALCTSTSYQIKSLYQMLRTQYKTSIYRDVVHVEIEDEDKSYDLFYFPYGSFICWGLSSAEAVRFVEKIRAFENQPLDKIETDDFTFSYGEQAAFNDDDIILPNRDIITKLAASHGLAQSVKLGAFETTLSNTFNKTRQIPQDLARTGSISLSRKQIRKKMGELFLDRSYINLHVDVLDTPEFFWEHPELEPIYLIIAKELEIGTRGEILNHRLDVVRELFEMLGNELNHQHSSRLEWTIIILIVIEVIISLLNIAKII